MATYRKGSYTRLFRTASIDAYNEGPHARRSWLMCRREMEPLGLRVGIIAARPAWSTATWWRQSEGVKAVASEAAGWIASL